MKKLASSKFIMFIIAGVVLIPSLLLTLFMAYIMLAPDDLPKPFYLSYQYPGPSEVAAETGEYQEISTASTTSDGDHGEPSGDHGDASSAYEAPISPAPTALLEIHAGQGLMVDTGTKIVNLAEPTGRRYIRVNIVLEFAPTALEYFSMAHEEQAAYVSGFTEDINTRMPVINDSLISLLSSKTFEDVYTAEGKEAVRNEIMDMLNIKLPEYRVIFVYFTEFVVQ